MQLKSIMLKTIALILLPGVSFVFDASAQNNSLEQVNSLERIDSLDPVDSQAAQTWNKIYEVFSHPRCANCHVPDDNLPRWSGPNYGKTSVHGMNISGGQSRIGVETVMCSTCHAHTNSDEPHGPPGAPVWMLAPVEMLWWQQSSNQICEQIKDPARNGGRTLEEVAHHIAEDELVHWGWDPGIGREPAPYSAKETADFVTLWANAGAPCPE
ncbi:hypothetical protein GMES_1755 [Paraglaciecola mesophila KMM 241]|uniref:Cytochrome c domain-containing protein n=1 Tax=Paraglaciecola mesophila KMM 241 TaxID=1128912 RepID=K6YJ81_9ALTE|nr:hypothetical protein [Paraglaciecola mesophila]GAC24051.1 hypothetical protein GMES_1755 [Paraglaciecola mesophila KMM 241]